MLENITWAVPGRVVQAVFSGAYTLEDVELCLYRFGDMVVNEGQPPYVHIMLDGVAVTELDKNILSLIKVGQMMRELPKENNGVGWVLSIDPDPNPALKFIGNVVMQVSNTRYRHLHTVDEAVQFLIEVDGTLPAAETWSLAEAR